MTEPLSADACTTMAEVRAGVDDVDRRLVALLVERFAYMRAAARIKPERNLVRDESRKAEVIRNVEAEAVRLGLPGPAIAAVWDGLVETSIHYEMIEYDRLSG